MCLRTTSEAAIVALLLSTPALGAEPKDFLVSTSQPRELRIMLDGVNAQVSAAAVRTPRGGQHVSRSPP